MPLPLRDVGGRALVRAHLLDKGRERRLVEGKAVLCVGVLGRNICRGDDRSPKERFCVIKCAPIAHTAVASDKRRPLRPACFEMIGNGRGNALAVNGKDEQQHGVLPKGLPHRQRRLPHCPGAGAGDRFRMAAPRKKAYVRHCSAPISSRIRAHSGISSREKPRHSFISAMTSSFGLPQRLLEREISSALKGMSVLSQL